MVLQRWGDAPVHSIAAALFSRKDQIHFFQDIGYRHESIERCPSGQDWSKGRCSCDYRQTFGETFFIFVGHAGLKCFVVIS
jgi:alpha 1,2-mannosyltransferase